MPKGTIVDGASIPRAFWTLIGGPFDGQYRNASIIHDYYCDRKTRPWREVHRVFYDGMISRAVSEPQAKIMYYAVYKFGPRWESKVERVPGRNFDGTLVMVNKTMSVDLPTSVYDNAKVEAAEKFISEDNPSLEEIETLADSQG